LYSKYSPSKGFVFTLEALIAFILIASFLGIASIKEASEENYLGGLELKRQLSNTITVLDANGFLIETIDSEGKSAGEKMDLIYGKFKELLPAGLEIRIELKDYTGNPVECRDSPSFNQCFSYQGVYPEKGPNPATGKDVFHERLLLVKKQPPAQCEVGAVFAGKETDEIEKAYFSEKTERLLFKPYTGAIFFSEEDDLNVSFGVRVTPPDEAYCDEDIRIDLNATVPDYGRQPADIMLVIDNSGSMDDPAGETNLGNIGSGTLNNGTHTMESSWGTWYCTNFGNWQDIATFEVDAELSQYDVKVRMDYSGYSGECDAPRMRVRDPGGETHGGSEGSSPLTETLDSPLQTGTYTVQGWSDETINYNVNYFKLITKMDAAKAGAQDFVDYEEWRQPLDQLGLVSFSTDAELRQQLLLATDANKEIINSQIESLEPDYMTAMGDAIYMATGELTGTRGNPAAMKFQVLLSDGCSNTGSDPEDAADHAATNDVIIYPIGYGTGSELCESTLEYIADNTGGTYYYAADQETLQEVYGLIALDIGSDLSQTEQERAYDSNLMIPLERCSDVADAGTDGQCQVINDQNYLWYDIGFLDKYNPFIDYFTINIPCDTEDACESTVKTLPFSITLLGYTSEEGIIEEPVVWDENVTVIFKYRDLTVGVLKAIIDGTDLIYVDVNAANTGMLESEATLLRYYADDPYTGTLLGQDEVIPLQPGSVQILYDRELTQEGWIYIVINPEGSIRECPGNNILPLYCTGISETQYFALDLWAWRD